ncbi:putative membrane protein [Alloactinosynnema sp. L-07]|uniref:hypothetical protein n=1 Tax=Alloactinosynnema sp. L-07 TaxID=1653480 RepID=UPI00065EFB82|nr:hypothetical protein [Alloactinosynnema sp. L-07]CRK60909.1 putative membrane protein [Alloactinosynnema sp. L-07]
MADTGIRRSEIIERAESWLRPSVAHSTTKFHQNEFGIYRTDCWGYVSMAWGLPDRRGGVDTVGLAEISTMIGQDDLLAGDILLDARHVTIFHEWADRDRAACWGFEQAAGTGTVRRLIPYPHATPRRYVNVYRGRLLA